ncbi:hypothetical protein BDZ91DRAFT_744270 [Kalaharituber pfeilii]|nr:hypothetical protein BDZ91DRAFT_744270 [Kalaharituber pfeilii]
MEQAGNNIVAREMLLSNIVTLVLADGKQFYIHEKLLRSLSNLLQQVPLNQDFSMGNFDERTVGLFLQWAYAKDYHVGSRGDVLTHTKVYMLANSFNIDALKDTSFGKLRTALKHIAESRSQRANVPFMGGEEVLSALRYAVEHLSEAANELVVGNALVLYLLRFLSWALPSVRHSTTWNGLLLNYPFLGIELLNMARPAKVLQWGE